MTRTQRASRQQEREASRQRIAASQAEARRIVASGVCPQCGTELRRNLALAGWWQCDAYGEPHFRRLENRSKPACSFQAFTA